MDVTLLAVTVGAVAVIGGVLLTAWAVLSRVQANATRIVELHGLLEQARERAPAQRLEETERYLNTVREEFNAVLESQDTFRDQVLKNVNRLSSLINRRLGGPSPGRRTDLEESREDEDMPDRITKEEAAERERRAHQPGTVPTYGPADRRAQSREEIRRRIRDQYYAARRAAVPPEATSAPEGEKEAS